MGCVTGLLVASLTPNCVVPNFSGLESDAYLFNSEDIASVTRIGNAMTFTMKAGKKGYRVTVDGSTPYNGTNSALTIGEYSKKFTKTLAFAYQNSGATPASNVNTLVNGKFVAIVENKRKGATVGAGDNAFLIIGIEKPLLVTAVTKDYVAEGQEGATLITMTTTEPTFECYWDGSSYDASKTAVSAIVNL